MIVPVIGPSAAWLKVNVEGVAVFDAIVGSSLLRGVCRLSLLLYHIFLEFYAHNGQKQAWMGNGSGSDGMSAAPYVYKCRIVEARSESRSDVHDAADLGLWYTSLGSS
jgi:hypothetical protein